MHSARGKQDRGFAMAALLVAMAIMAVVMSAALPVWHTAARREKEAELIFRGQQYARAVALYQRRFPGATPPNLDALLNEHMLRKKYKDPITNDDFQLIGAADGMGLQGAGGVSPGVGIPGAPGRPGTPSTSPGGFPGGGFPGGGLPAGGAQQPGNTQQPGSSISSAFGRPAASAPGTAAGGIMGVVSKSTGTALRLYNGRNKYNEWVFVATQASNRAGGPGGGAPGTPGGGGNPASPGGRPGGPGGPGGRTGFPPGGGNRGRVLPPGGGGFGPPPGDGVGGFGPPPGFPGPGGRRNF